MMLFTRSKLTTKEALSSPVLLFTLGTPWTISTKTKRFVFYESGFQEEAPVITFLEIFLENGCGC